MKELSIITPLYNTPRPYLMDVLNSVEPYADNVELILVNDSPTNQRLCAFLGELRKPHVKVLHNPKNMGIFDSYLNGFLHASGQYCCILDHDDVFDPEHVLRAIEQEGDADMIFTDEYKFEGDKDDKTVKRTPFLKPDFDILSSVFYFYTHHVTVLRRDIVQRQLRKYTVPGKYTSIFDIHYTLEYMKAFAGRPLKVCHLPHTDYGWRIHAGSTAQSLDQKPAGYFERLKKVEEFLRFFGETPLLAIDAEIGYLVTGIFLSPWDCIRYPLQQRKFAALLEKRGEIVGPELSLILEPGEYTEKDYDHFFHVLMRLPVRYLLRQNVFPLRIPAKQDMPKVDPTNWERHCANVPFISPKESTQPGLVLSPTKERKPDQFMSTVLIKNLRAV